MHKGAAVAVLAIGLAMAATGAAPPQPGADSGVAQTAAKKCKKKPKGAKKKVRKCKRPKKPAAPAPTPSRVVRASLTWNTNDNLQLFARVPSGSTCYSGNGAGQGICDPSFPAGFRMTHDQAAHLDQAVEPQFLAGSSPELSFAICVYQGLAASADTVAKLEYVTADGATHRIETGIGQLQSIGGYKGIPI